MPTVVFGNSAPIDTEKIDPSKDADFSNLRRKKIAYEQSVTMYEVPGGTDLAGALMAITRVWFKNHSDDPPEWVESTDSALELLCASYFTWTKEEGPPSDQGDFIDKLPKAHKCKTARPAGWEHGAKSAQYGTRLDKPGEAKRLDEMIALARFERMRWPEQMMDVLASGDPLALKTTNGIDHVARLLGGDRVGQTGTATSAPTATTLTDSGGAYTASSGGPPESGGYVGHKVVVDASPQVYGNIIANSGTVLTIDYWHAPATPGAQASTPANGARYTILPGGAPAFWMGFSVATDTSDVADTFLDNNGSISEIFGTFNTGLARQPVTYAHTLGAATYTLSKAFTAISADGASNTIFKLAVFANGVLVTPTASNSGVILFTTDLTNTATLIAGDIITPTDTITIS